MRRAAQQLTREQPLSLLENGSWGVLSTVDDDGAPYGVPLNYVVCDGHVCFHCAVEGHKVADLARDPRVCFTVVGADEVVPEDLTTKFASVICFGRTRRLEGAEKNAALRALGRRFAPGLDSRVDQSIGRSWERTDMWAISIDAITGKRGKLLDPTLL